MSKYSYGVSSSGSKYGSSSSSSSGGGKSWGGMDGGYGSSSSSSDWSFGKSEKKCPVHSGFVHATAADAATSYTTKSAGGGTIHHGEPHKRYRDEAKEDKTWFLQHKDFKYSSKK